MPTQSSNKTALFALIGLTIIFVWIVGYGWFRTFTTWGEPVLAWGVAFLLPVIAVTLAWAIANERRINPKSLAIPAAYFFILFILSALGTINTLFFNMQGLKVMQAELESFRAHAVKLKERGKQTLSTPTFEEFQRRVLEKWGPLKAEILNPQRCGQGPEALERIKELQKELPAFKTMSGGGCAHAKELVGHYEEAIKELVQRSEEALKAAQFIRVRGELESLTDNLISLLDGEKEKLKNVGHIAQVKVTLQAAANSYYSIKEKLDATTGKISDLPPKIIIKSLPGDLGAVVDFTLTRLNDVTTYFYVLVALMLDVVMIFAFKAVLASSQEHRNQLTARTPIPIL